jgi:hypothetical protein
VRIWIGRALAGLGCGFFALPVIATWRAEGLPHVMPIVSAALLLVTIIRPAWGLVMLSGVLPLTAYLWALMRPEMLSSAFAEIFVAPFLLGACLRTFLGLRLPRARLAGPALLLGALIVVGGILGLAARQQATTWPIDFLRALLQHLWTGYFQESADFFAWQMAAIWIEGLALAVFAERLVRGRAVAVALVAGVTLAAATTWLRLVQISLRRPEPLIAAVTFVRTLRINTLFTDVNAAGSLYVLGVVPAAWLALQGYRASSTARRRLVSVGAGAAAVITGLALVMTHSRAAYGGALLGLAALAVASRRVSRRTLAVSLTATIAMFVAFVLLNRGSATQVSSGESMGIRWEMAKIAMHITREQPIFGVGLGEFRQASRPLVPPSLVAAFPAAAAGENAHNNFLQILAELGIAGFAAFVWLLGSAGRLVVRARWAKRADISALALAGGVLAFLVTCLAGHPFLTTEVLWTFLLTLGATAGLARDADEHAPSGWRRHVVSASILMVLLIAPVRFWMLRQADLQRDSIGAGPRILEPGEPPYRLAAERSAWFVPGDVRLVQIPLRTTRDSPSSCLVRVDVDGTMVNRVEATTAGWRRVDLVLQPGEPGSPPHRVELRVSSQECQLMVGELITRD